VWNKSRQAGHVDVVMEIKKLIRVERRHFMTSGEREENKQDGAREESGRALSF
jgi:hypothetical protein